MPRPRRYVPSHIRPMTMEIAEKIRAEKRRNPKLLSNHLARMFDMPWNDVKDVLANRKFLPLDIPPTQAEIAAIREMRENDPDISQADIARELCLRVQLVHAVLNGKLYKEGDAPARAGRKKKQRAFIVTICAIDPGKKGAIAFLSDAGKVIEVFDMPTRLDGTKKLVDAQALARILRRFDVQFMAIERVGSMPTDGHQGAFDFGRSVGLTEGAMALTNPAASMHRYDPTVWKPYFHLSKDKDAALAMARTIWPDAAAQLTRHDRAEAALIGLFALQDLKKKGYIAPHAQEPDPGSDPFA